MRHRSRIAGGFFGKRRPQRRVRRLHSNCQRDREVEYGAALALAMSGDASSQSQTLANDLEKTVPRGYVVRFSYLPVLRARIALNQGEPAKAIELLQTAIPYELGVTAKHLWVFRGILSGLYPRRGISGSTSGRRGCHGISENSRSPWDRRQRSHRSTGALATRKSIRFVGRYRSKRRLPTRISSLSGKTPIPTSRFSVKRGRNTPSCSNNESDLYGTS